MSRQWSKLMAGFVVATAALSCCGCGTTSNDGSSGQPSGGGANGGANSGAGASGASGGAVANGGTASSGDTQAEACVAYYTAVCKRQATCDGSPRQCDFPSDLCPDLFFSSGATRTVAGLKACAETYATLPCEQVAFNITPPCVTPGTRQLGEECKFPAQCASLNCGNMNGGTCGTCREPIANGQPCTPSGDRCASGSYCTNQGTCAPRPAYMPPKPLGAPCAAADVCGGSGEATCKDGTCTLVHGENTACSESIRCADGFGCGLSDMRCHALPQQGQPCLRGVGMEIRLCAEGSCRLHLPDTVGTCGAYAKLGESCRDPIPDSLFWNGLVCEAGTHCGGDPQAPTCLLDGSYGAACTNTECQDGFVCQCPITQPSCAYGTQTCHKRGSLGDPCSTEDPCLLPFTCENARCVSGPSQGLFEQACGKQ